MKYDIKLDRMETSKDTGSYFKFGDINIVKQEGDENAITVGGQIELLKDIDKSQQVNSQFCEFSLKWYFRKHTLLSSI